MRETKRPQLVQRTDYLLARSAGRSVLHLGCTNHPYTDQSVKEGTLLHSKLADVAKEVVGFDFDQAGIDALSKYNFGPLYLADLENLSAVGLDRTFDVIVAGEMIEHLSNPGLFLSGIKRFMRPGSTMVVTTVNAYCGMRFLQYALRGRGGSAEPVHPDHVAYYSYKTLRLVLERAGFVLTDLCFYDLGPEHRIHNRPALNVINDICVRIGPQLADGLIAVCELED